MCSVRPFFLSRMFLLVFLRWDSAGGEARTVMETQHAHRVPGGRLLATGPRKENDQGRGDNGGKLRHPA